MYKERRIISPKLAHFFFCTQYIASFCMGGTVALRHVNPNVTVEPEPAAWDKDY